VDFTYLTRLLDSYVNDKEVAGVSACIIKDGKQIYRKNFGYADKENKIFMQDNTIYRMFSMTKPVTAAASMILAERGLMDLNAPLYSYIPEFKQMQVAVSAEERSTAKNPILIKNLLNMTSGLPYPDINTVSGAEMGKVFEKMADDMNKGELWDTQKFIKAFAKVPLAFEPGERWLYGVSADIMGAVIEVISGMTFGEFLKKEIFEPLSMKDTDFYVPKEKRERFAQIYEFDEHKNLVPFTKNHLCLNGYLTPPAFESGGAGLVSTVEDYSRFAQMLLNGGEYQKKRILSRKSVDFMKQNHLTLKQLESDNWESQRGYGYGILMRSMINVAESGCLGSEGEYGWDGWSGNWFCIDSKENLIMLFMIQRAPGNQYYLVNKFKNTVYSAVSSI